MSRCVRPEKFSGDMIPLSLFRSGRAPVRRFLANRGQDREAACDGTGNHL